MLFIKMFLKKMVKTLMADKQKNRVLVTGGNGFIGKYLVNALLAEGFLVTALDLMPIIEIEHENLNVLIGSFANPTDLDIALENVSIVFHLASTTVPKTSNDDPVYDIESNLIGGVLFIRKCIEVGVEKFIYISSGGTVYGNPVEIPVKEDHETNPMCSYGITKLALEKYLRMYGSVEGFKPLILRLSNPYGFGQNPLSGQGVIASFVYKSMNNEAIEIWGDGKVVRDYIHISDVISAFISCCRVDYSPGTVLNISSGYGHSLNDIISIIERELNRKLKINFSRARDFDIPLVYLDNFSGLR